MAWIIGLVSEAELASLRKIGWRDESPPLSLMSEEEKHYLEEGDKEPELKTRAFFVDSDVHTIMTGPGWEPAP